MYFVYVLKSLKNQRLYTGSTNDLARRLREHNSGASKYTKLNRPFVLEYREVFRSKSEAYKREMFFKSGKGREWLKDNNIGIERSPQATGRRSDSCKAHSIANL